MFQTALDALYDVTEVSSVGAIPSSVVIDALKLVNPALETAHAEAIVSKFDARGRQLLVKEDFQNAVRTVLQSTDVPDAIHILRELVSRMRQTYRRRYLMYEAPCNRCPPPLLQNATSVAMYRELFDVVARGDDYIARSALRALTAEVLGDHPTDAANIVKAALGETERDLIGFEEFIMVMQPATARRQLSAMVDLAKSAAMLQQRPSDMPNRTAPPDGAVMRVLGSPITRPTSPSMNDAPLTSTLEASGGDAGNQSGNDWLPLRYSDNRNHQQQAPGFNSPPPLSSAVGSRPKKSEANRGREGFSTQIPLSLHHELEAAKQHHLVAEEAFQEAVAAGGHRENALDASLRQFQGEDRCGVSTIPTMQEREMAQLRLENEALRHAVSQSTLNRAQLTPSLSQRGFIGSDSKEVAELRGHIVELESELRSCRAQLAVRTEATQLAALLKHHSSSHDGLRNYYRSEESTLVSKHDYLRNTAQPFYHREGSNSAIAILLSQYDLVVCGYQTLYRDLKTKYEATVAPRYDSIAAASGILPRNPPSRYGGQPSRTGSPAKFTSAPLKWSVVDGAVSTDMKRSGTLRDPLLTDEERNQLRAKLATQMRSAARHYTPPRAGSAGRSHRGASRLAAEGPDLQTADGAFAAEGAFEPGAATQLTSIQSLSRLQSLASKAGRQRNFW